MPYLPALVAMLIVGVAAAYVVPIATRLLFERTGVAAASVAALGMGIVASIAVVALGFGASPTVVNVLAGLTCLGCLALFAKVTARSRHFDRLTRELLDPKTKDQTRTLAALREWLAAGVPSDGGDAEQGGDTAEVALALIASGRVDEALPLLQREFPATSVSAAERSRLAGTRALAQLLRGEADEPGETIAGERAAPQDFISKPYVTAYDALIDAMRGEGERALVVLGNAGARAGEPCVARWARAHALAASVRTDEALDLLRRQRAVHGDCGVVPVMNLPGPASGLARELLGEAAKL